MQDRNDPLDVTRDCHQSVTLCQYILLVLIRVYSSVEPKFCDRYLLNVSARCQMNLLALNSLRLPSFELSDNQKLGDDTGVAFWLKIHSKFGCV